MALGGTILRELGRVGTQIAAARWRVMGPAQRWLYDRKRARVVRVTQGALPAGDEMALMLIYQPAGVLGSTLFSLAWLGRQGVVPIIVSNAPLSDADRERLAGVCHLLIERPNLGYDFGGYREGVMTLEERGIRPRALYVMNDSIWFPLREDCDVITRARASDADMFGLFSNAPRRGSAVTHLQSYFFRFGPRLLDSPHFQRYWKGVELIGDKYTVIRRYERRLTPHFTELGFTAAAVHTRQDLTDLLLALSDEELQQVIDYQCETDQKDAERLQLLLAKKDQFSLCRPQIESWIRQRKIHHSYFAAHPIVLHRLGVPFLKKGGNPALPVQRQLLRKLGLDRDFAAPVLSEIAGWDSGQPRIERDINAEQG